MRIVFLAFLMFTATFQLFAQQTVQTPTTFAPMGGIAVGSLNSSGAASFSQSVSTGVAGAPTAGMLTLYGQGASGGAIRFQAPNSVSSSYNWLLPNTTPAANSFLLFGAPSAGTSTLSFVTFIGSGGITVTQSGSVFTFGLGAIQDNFGNPLLSFGSGGLTNTDHIQISNSLPRARPPLRPLGLGPSRWIWRTSVAAA